MARDSTPFPRPSSTPEIVTETRESVLYEQATLDIVTNPTLPSAAEVPVGVSRQQAQVDFNIYSVLWLAGMVALLVHALVSAGKLKRKLATAILLRDNIYESEFVDSPFVFGVVKPNIYLPMHMDEGTAAYVIAHERAHLARRDHWWKVLGYLVLALHWFNPLVWWAAALSRTAERCFVIGGGSVYQQMLPFCDAAYVTKVHVTPESDTFFPNLDEDKDWYLAETLQSGEENGIAYEMCLYRRK